MSTSHTHQDSAVMQNLRNAMADEVCNGLSSMFYSGSHTDLAIRCGDKSWKVHRIVLIASSKYFAKLLDEDSLESSPDVIDLDEDVPEFVYEMLRSFYDRDYDDSALNTDPLPFNAHMYALASKYGTQLLQNLAELKFAERLDNFDETTMIPSLVAAVSTIYTTTPNTDRNLRNRLAPLLRANIRRLRANESFNELLKAGFADGDFVGDLANALAGVS